MALACLRIVDEIVVDARLGATGVGPRAVRLETLERALIGRRADAALLDATARQTTDHLSYEDLPEASLSYRRALSSSVMRRALLEAASMPPRPGHPSPVTARMIGIRLNVNGNDYELDVEARSMLADVIREGLRTDRNSCRLPARRVRRLPPFCSTDRPCGPVSSLPCRRAADPSRRWRVLPGATSCTRYRNSSGGINGLQCGYCTPGFLMLALGALRERPRMTDDELREILSSNLCRCTGYKNIFEAVRAAALELGVEGDA